MAKKPASSSGTAPESELAEAVNRLGDSVSVLTDIVTQLRSDIDWIINNRAEFRSETPPAINHPEPVSCSECDAVAESLAGALQAGWSELTGDDEIYLGLCRKCLDEHCPVMPTPVLPNRAITESRMENAI